MLEAAEEKAVVKFLGRFTQYPFLVRFGKKDYSIGQGAPAFVVDFKRPIPPAKLMTSTSLALGEAYMDGDLEVEGDLYDALNHFLGQMEQFSTDERALKKLLYTSVSRKNQAKEVTSHYDIGNDFYRLWLDETMSYSCAYFCSGGDSLYQAQVNKTDYILKKLYLQEEMTLLDIGCGWGFLLIEAAKKYKIKGTGITLSKEQYAEFKNRIRREGLEDRLEVLLMDYRDLPSLGKRYDRVVSVGMAEHVGRENYQLFIRVIQEALKDGGLMLLHFISGLKEHGGDPWIKKYIFPGGVIPSLREMISAMADSGFHTMDVENLRLHYNKTLLCWEENYRNHRDEIERMFDERFVRMWELYLASCAAAFYNGVVDLHQVLASKGINNQLPMVRWY